MQVLSKPSSAAKTALFYITAGSLMVVWTACWWIFNRPENRTGQLFCVGFFFTGLVLLVIGFSLGRIGREARHAELPPKEVTPGSARPAAPGQPVAPTQAVNPAVAAPSTTTVAHTGPGGPGT